MKVNKNYENLEQSYLFSTIAKKVREYSEGNPDKRIIRLGVGDVTKPLCKAVIDAMHKAVDEMGVQESFRGYGPEQGYDFLRVAVQNYYKKRNVDLDLEEIFISDGAKSDLGNILDLLDKDNVVLIPDPVYPAYVDTNIMDGRKVVFASGNAENDFLPGVNDIPNGISPDIIYICSPNNPTGAVYNKEQLKEWVNYANEKKALILFDSAYESDPELPRSIFEIEGAKTCAVEICSLSKTAGFTGTRCGYTIVPKNLGSLNKMWLRRQTTKYNGVPYIVQRGAEAVFTEEGKKEIAENLDYYKENAKIISQTMEACGIWYVGGKHSPYIWLKCPNNMSSWEFFDFLLEKIQVVGTPGSGFGRNGEGYFRLTSFGSRENTTEAMERFKTLFK